MMETGQWLRFPLQVPTNPHVQSMLPELSGVRATTTVLEWPAMPHRSQLRSKNQQPSQQVSSKSLAASVHLQTFVRLGTLALFIAGA
jgi:hypothetical protein